MTFHRWWCLQLLKGWKIPFLRFSYLYLVSHSLDPPHTQITSNIIFSFNFEQEIGMRLLQASTLSTTRKQYFFIIIKLQIIFNHRKFLSYSKSFKSSLFTWNKIFDFALKCLFIGMHVFSIKDNFSREKESLELEKISLPS